MKKKLQIGLICLTQSLLILGVMKLSKLAIAHTAVLILLYFAAIFITAVCLFGLYSVSK